MKLLGCLALVLVCSTQDPARDGWWDDRVAASIDRCPERRADWVGLLKECPEDRRKSLAYLVADLPIDDLRKLPTAAIAETVALAQQARSEVPWGDKVPDDVFLDAVLPHASVTEPRDSIRREFHDRYLPLVKSCAGPGAAADALNRAVFRDFKVTYNTKRLRTDQNSRESIAQGMATCTGLSILLVEACRSVGVPARLAGIASWPGRGGNHTWVEVWDDGWHHVGAAEPDDQGLDHAWFTGEAARAIQEVPQNAIWAARYRSTGAFFPLAWAPSARVPGENVTVRYTGGKTNPPPPPRLMVEVREGGERVEAEVKVVEQSTGRARAIGASFGPQLDINRRLTCEAPPQGNVFVTAQLHGRSALASAAVSGDTVVKIDLERFADQNTRESLEKTLADRFGDDPSRKDAASKVLAELPWDETVRDLAWRAYKQSPVHEPLRKEYEANKVVTADRESPYLWRHVGEKPAGGWALVIAMHGGGGAPKAVNDSQWKGMFERYYKDHPEAGGYVYLALRAPNDEWNGFYDDAICPLVERLILQFVLFGEVDPDRVYTLGASHGGYGAFVIGPKIADRFAAVHASASAPTDGETRGENLRNVRFTFMVGENDTAYGRAERCQAFAKKLEEWRREYGGYPGGFEWKPGVGHSVPDRDKVAEMLQAGPRNPRPDRVVWFPTDSVLKHSYWVEADQPKDGARIVATLQKNVIELDASDPDRLAFWIDPSQIDPAQPITLKLGDRQQEIPVRPDPEVYCRGLIERADPRLATPIRIAVAEQP